MQNIRQRAESVREGVKKKTLVQQGTGKENKRVQRKSRDLHRDQRDLLGGTTGHQL